MMENNGNGVPADLHFDEEVCERYLFGELNEAEQEKFEAAYFGDDAFFEKFMAVKTELLDLYSRGELEEGKRARMEPHFLATAPRRRRLEESGEFIRAVNAISDRDRRTAAAVVVSDRPSFFETIARYLTLPSLAGAAVILIIAVIGIYFLNRTGPEGEQNPQFAQQPESTEPPAVAPPPSGSTTSEGDPSKPEVTANPTNTKDDTSDGPVRPRSEVAARPKTDRPNPLRRNETQPAPDRQHITLDRPNPLPRMETQPTPDQRYIGSNPSNSNQATVEFTLPEPALTLQAGATRDIGTGNTLTLPAHTRSATLTLLFRSERFVKYIVTITNVDGTEVFQKLDYENRLVRDVKDGSKQLRVHLNDTTEMSEKDYIVKLEGHSLGKNPETLEEYYFRVRRVTKNSTAGDPRPEPTKKPWE